MKPTLYSLLVLGMVAPLGVMAMPKKADPVTTDTALVVKVIGPAATSFPVGTLVKLKADGNAKLWSWSDGTGKAPETSDDHRTLYFSSPVAGVYTFILAGADEDELLQVASTITLTGPPAPPGPGPGPGPNPQPQPVVAFKTLVRGWLASVNTPGKAAECQRLAFSYETLLDRIARGELKDETAIRDAAKAQNLVAVGAARDGWLPFFTSMATELVNRKATAADVVPLFRDLIDVLKEVQPAPAPAPQKQTTAPPGQRRV